MFLSPHFQNSNTKCHFMLENIARGTISVWTLYLLCEINTSSTAKIKLTPEGTSGLQCQLTQASAVHDNI
jgi:hypothetical protein